MSYFNKLGLMPTKKASCPGNRMIAESRSSKPDTPETEIDLEWELAPLSRAAYSHPHAQDYMAKAGYISVTEARDFIWPPVSTQCESSGVLSN